MLLRAYELQERAQDCGLTLAARVNETVILILPVAAHDTRVVLRVHGLDHVHDVVPVHDHGLDHDHDYVYWAGGCP